MGLKLSTDEVHIWYGVLDHSESDLYVFFKTLSSDERMRAGRLHRYEDEKRFIARHGMLRMIIGGYLAVEPRDLRFIYGKNGKPAIAEISGKKTIQFNISHSNGVALFAFARNHEIGVDIEHIRDISEMELIAERFFSQREKESIRSLPEEQRRGSFIKGWTCKEAFIKALGDGLSRALDSFEVSMIPGEPAKLLSVDGDSSEASHWSMQYLQPAPDYYCAFAVKSLKLETKLWRWERTGSGESPSW